MATSATWLIWAFIAGHMLATQANTVRKSVSSLSQAEELNLRIALGKVMEDEGPGGFQALAAYHGAPAGCAMANGKKVACCIHGMPTFPHWHRLFVTQLEQSLIKHGAATGVPYWDWSHPISRLPHIVRDPLFIDPNHGKVQKNPFYEGHINSENVNTARAVDDRLFEHPEEGHNTRLLNEILLALEQDDFCQFEIQFEVSHNAIHYLVGGPYKYGMSTLDWTSYDPIFYLHHSMVDRLFAIWQALQRHRNKPSDYSNCAIELMSRRMQPFARDTNPFKHTRLHSTPNHVWDMASLGYEYDTLELNGMGIAELDQVLNDRKARARVFAAFRLNGIGTSADVKIYVCLRNHDDKKEDDCSHYAGHFFVLGGPTEMPWSFSGLYLHDITDTIDDLHISYDGDYYIHLDISAVNGTHIPMSALDNPHVVYRPAAGAKDATPHHPDASTLAVRKDVSRLTAKETFELRQAMARVKRDKSVDGYQALAEYHGLPAKCPRPDAKERYACCLHGMPTFVHWHRLYIVQLEDAIRRRGSPIGMPYWDWTRPMKALPTLATEATFVNPTTSERVPNPFYKSQISSIGVETKRDPQDALFQDPAFGHHTNLYEGVMYAFEQDNFCDFAVQFEVVHNMLHALVGGSQQYSFSSLHYTSFDPLFFLHHSNVDRLWAIWQQLQIHREKPYKAHCANSYVHMSLKPFGFPVPLNSNLKTHDHAIPTKIYDYENELGYGYDSLEFGGMTVDQLDTYLDKRSHVDRYFAGFQLRGIKTSALVTFHICKADGNCDAEGGKFAILGGPKEMDWRFDRLYRHEITAKLAEMGLSKTDRFTIKHEMAGVDGTAMDSHLVPEANIIFVPKTPEHEVDEDWVILRKDASTLTPEETTALQVALGKMQADASNQGFETIASYHGIPNTCPSPEAAQKFACCLHGMATFIHWHRLYMVQFEDALRHQGYTGAVPYWDWSKPMKAIPALAADETYEDPTGGTTHNPWHDGTIGAAGGVKTKRSLSQNLWFEPKFGEFTHLGQELMLAFEEENFCDFAVQFEVTHNGIHALVGGFEQHSMASLRYTTFDPIFFLHHSSVDRYWAIWQALQKYRGNSYNKANCALERMRAGLKPFSLNLNPNDRTREHASPFQVFDYEHNFGYRYDNLEFNGLTIPQLSREVDRLHSLDRVFANFMLHGIQKSALVKFYICKSESDCDHFGGAFYMLGDTAEMPWRYDRSYKYEITQQLKELDLRVDDFFYVRQSISDLNKNELPSSTFPTPTVSYSPAQGTFGGETEWIAPVTAANRIRKDISTLTRGETESLRNAFLRLERDKNRGYEYIAGFHGLPAKCPSPDNPKYACCLHGMPTFPHWHRLYVVQVENALLELGSAVAVPYWDWTKKFDRLPSLVSDPTYYNSRTFRLDKNPFFRGEISFENTFTTRDPQPELYDNDYFFRNVLLAFEQEDFCDFEVQFEIVHNAIHAWVGGRDLHSMAELHYTAYDPIFFLHHSNVDRIWAIWQELQRYRKKPHNSANCALPDMKKPIKPFSFDDSINHDWMTRAYSRPADAFDYHNHFRYKYDNLEFNGMSIPKLQNDIDSQKSHDRVFAGFLLSGIQTSASVKIYICTTHDGRDDCSNYAGIFTVLGGEKEMPWAFDRLYKYDITPALHGLGMDANSDFHIAIDVVARNGSHLPDDVFPKPTVVFQPGKKSHQVDHHDEEALERKNVNSLSKAETNNLMSAFRAVQADSSADGFQAIASFHALPPLCPNPAASKRFACCIHGMATFPQWHRIYVVQLENALKRHGSTVGMPYWDWTHPYRALPHIFTDTTFTDPETHKEFDSPLQNVPIAFANTHVEREISEANLFEQPSGKHGTWLYEHVMLALEQTNYCDFEVQFEMAHNAIHAWVGGSKEHSLGHLHYASYDPMFFFHHSNVDRIWAVWQKLQKYRGLSGSEANCALELMHEPLKPFSFGAPWNLNPITHKYSKPADTFDYENHFHYHYDHLEIGGMNVPQLDRYVKERQEHDRVFAGFLLGGFGSSATVTFQLCSPSGSCTPGGSFYVLGGSMEMTWAFDRLFKYDITSAVKTLGARNDDALTVTVAITAMNGSSVSSSVMKPPTVFFVPGKESVHDSHVAPNRVRRSVRSLSKRDTQSLMSALRNLKEDKSADGFEAIAAFHGSPAKCKTADDKPVACCIHGMAAFPHWHRLYMVQFESALRRHGSSAALPYWDWVHDPHIPAFLTEPNYYDAWQDSVFENPFARGKISHEDTYTARDVQVELLEAGQDGIHSALWYKILLAFEQEDYCDFEVQFEVVHNAIHYMIGGRHTYSVSSLSYTSYDPLFYLHHSEVDRLWAIWQALQKHRHQPHDKAYCALEQMSKPMKPFSFDDTFNLNSFTHDHSTPNSLFDFESLGYTYDSLKFDGRSIAELDELIHTRKNHDRVFAGFLLRGIGISADVHFSVCTNEEHCVEAGFFFILGSDLEMAWSFDRLYKHDITHAVEGLGLHLEDLFKAQETFYIKLAIVSVEGNKLSSDSIPAPTIIYQPASSAAEVHAGDYTSGRNVRKNVDMLTPSEIASLRDALRQVQADSSPHGFQAIAAYHGLPAMCKSADGSKSLACCAHGMPTFPHWHRLFTKQMEDALTAKGAKVGMPYWDWTAAFTALPSLVTETENNPFYQGDITFMHTHTTREPVDYLFKDPELGEKSFFYRHVLYALEQTDYCDFEVQFEMSHNTIHNWVGGSSIFSMSTLDYTSYDPLFYIHHSNTDRIWAIWQALQKYRGLPYKTAFCALNDLRVPLKPFSFDTNWNALTRTHAKPIDVFDYENLDYHYDNLRFGGLDIPHLEDLLNTNRHKDRIFAGFLLSGIQTSANVKFQACLPSGECTDAGIFQVLGGETEMPWAFDRLFKYDITEALEALRADYRTVFSLKYEIIAINGSSLSIDLLHPPSIIYEPGVGQAAEEVAVVESNTLVRKELSTLTLDEAKNLRDAMFKLMNDEGNDGFEAIAQFHGAPGKCPEGATDNTYSCCIHGMPAFPHWHRLFVVQAEQALQAHGATVGIPYWDWTQNLKALPNFVAETDNNPWHRGYIRFEQKYTTRTINPRLFDPPLVNGHNFLYHNVLLSLEEDDYCDFEVQFEIFHNTIHAWVGGADTHSLATLEYSAFDPLFLVHHSNMDRLWIIWQELQRLRGKPYNSAPCARKAMDTPMQPFSFESLNPNLLTRSNARPISSFDHDKFGYDYDSLTLNGMSISDLQQHIQRIKQKDRHFIGFATSGFGMSANVDFYICVRDDDECNNYAGSFSVLGGPTEMPWALERLFKYEVTGLLKKLGYTHTSEITVRTVIKAVNGTQVDVSFPEHVVIFRPGNSDHDVYVFGIGRGRTPPPKVVAKHGTRIIFNPWFEPTPDQFVVDMGSYTEFYNCHVPTFGFHSYAFREEHSPSPGTYFFTARKADLCKQGRKFIFIVDQ